MARKVVYVAGPYRSDSEWGVIQNIRSAEQLALEVWRLGCVAICPHKNTAGFGGALPDTVWLEGDIDILARCDALICVEGWQKSIGATGEVEFALEHSIPVLETVEGLKSWLNSQSHLVDRGGSGPG